MNLKTLIQSNTRLDGIICYQQRDVEGACFTSAVEFRFRDETPAILVIDVNTDELIWAERRPQGLTPATLESLCQPDAIPYGESLLWYWEMKNQQGYFDALQVEFSGRRNSEPAILQFKAAASHIEIYQVRKAEPNTSGLDC